VRQVNSNNRFHHVAYTNIFLQAAYRQELFYLRFYDLLILL
jgi:hypothetical protein